MKSLLISSMIVCMLILNYACSPTGILATQGGSAMVVAEGDRSFGEVVDDATIKVNIAGKFLSNNISRD